MSGYILVKWAKPKARRDRSCDECGRVIHAGETYGYGSGKDDTTGSFATWSYCEHCDWLMNFIINTEDIGSDELYDVAESMRELVHGTGPGWTYSGPNHERVEVHGDIGPWLRMARIYAWYLRHWARADGTTLPLETIKELSL